MGFTAAKMTRTALPLLWKLAGIEALALAQAADFRGREQAMGKDYRKLYDVVRSVSPTLKGDRPLADDILKVTSLLQSEEVQQQCLPSYEQKE